MQATCTNNQNYTDQLTLGKLYEISIQPGHFESDPYAVFIGDNGAESFCHIRRFEIEE